MNINSIQQRLTPECTNAGNAITKVSWVSVGISVILVILLVAVIIYDYVVKDKTDTTRAEATSDTKTKVVGGLTITSTILSVLALGLTVWTALVGQKVHRCINVTR